MTITTMAWGGWAGVGRVHGGVSGRSNKDVEAAHPGRGLRVVEHWQVEVEEEAVVEVEEEAVFGQMRLWCM